MDHLNDDGTVVRYGEPVTHTETFPNTNDSDNNDGSGNPDDPDGGNTGTQPPDGSDPPTTDGANDHDSQMAAYSDGNAADGSTSSQLGNGGVPTGGTVVTQPNGEQWVFDADGNLFGMINENGNVIWPTSWPTPSDSPSAEAAIPPIIRLPWMDWNGTGPGGISNPRLHGNDIPDHVPREWSREKIEQALDEVEISIRNRRRVLDPNTESPEAHEKHKWKIQQEQAWKRKLEAALKSAAVTGAATGAAVGTGYSI